MTLEDENTRLRAENAALREQVQGLLAEVHQLRGQLAQDSRNSSKPPSSDGFARKTKSLRQKSGKKPGGQPGHRGHHVRLVETPDTVVEHRPARCGGCQQELPEDAPHWIERRQVHELPPVRLTVTEHQIVHRRCLACGVTTEGEVPSGVAAPRQYGPRLRAVATYLIQQQFVPYARTQELFADLFGVRLSQGTLVNLVRQGAERLQPLVEQIKVALRQAPVLHQDETGLRVAGAEGAGGQWTHVTCTKQLTHYACHAARGASALEAIGILPGYTGVSVHDGWTSYRHYTTCRHALCNAHHLRELTFVEEELHQPWAGQFKGLLRQMHAAVEYARAAGATQLEPAVRDRFLARYEALLADGVAQNPQPPPPAPRRRGRRKQSPVRNLLDRLWAFEHEVLAFLADFAIPFDNNQAERDLRPVKIQQKISGTFRSERGAEAFCTLRSVLATWRKHGRSGLAALEAAFIGRSLSLQPPY
ncbi:MAG TPA: IS66 family transposase [Longimicrobiales bacterium]